MQKIIWAIVFLGLAVILAFGVAQPAYQLWTDSQSLLGQVSAAKNSASDQLQQLNSLSQQVQQLQSGNPQQLARINQVAPLASESETLAEVYNLVGMSGIQTTAINQVADTSSTSTGTMIKRSILNISFNGDYPSIKRFLTSIETSARLFDFMNLSLQSIPVVTSGPASAKVSGQNINGKITLRIYYQ